MFFPDGHQLWAPNVINLSVNDKKLENLKQEGETPLAPMLYACLPIVTKITFLLYQIPE